MERVRAAVAVAHGDPSQAAGGCSGVWCGVANIPCIGVAHTERVKTFRACAILTRVASHDATLIWGDYRSLAGLLEHLLPIVGMNRRYMHELYHIHCVFAKAPPTTPLGSHTTEAVSDRASEWYGALSSCSCPGVLAGVRLWVSTDSGSRRRNALVNLRRCRL